MTKDEAMEAAIMTEVASIRRWITEALETMEIFGQKDYDFINNRLGSIEQTLREEVSDGR